MSVDHRGPDRDDRARMVGRRAEGAGLLTRRTFALVLAGGRGATLRRAVIDKRCNLPDGFTAGVHRDEDKSRFHVTERGITLITSSMLGERKY